MVDEETRRKLRELGMGEMVEALDLQESDGISMAVAFDDRIWMMVDYAYEAKYISSVKRLAARAKLRFPDAEMGEMIYDGRKIDGVLICEAGTCQFVASAANGVIEGLTGADKSYLACCIAKQACKMLRKYAHYELLVVDEWLTEGVDDKDISLLFEPIERRYAAESTMPCTQYTPAEWHGRLGGGVQADAMVDRLVHESARIDLGDVNVRKLLAEKR